MKKLLLLDADVVIDLHILDLFEMAGIRSETKQPVSDEAYFQRLAKATKAIGRYPKASEKNIALT